MTGLELRAEPQTSMVDELVHIRVAGARPRTTVTISARATGADGNVWRSEAAFDADRRGFIDLATDAPVDGTYAGADLMGLFWSMRSAGNADALLPNPGQRSLALMLSASDEAGTTARMWLTRQFSRPTIERTDVRTGGLVGTFFRPRGETTRQGVVVVGGSGGGIPEDMAGVLGSHGLAALAVAYFGVHPLPEELVEVPLDYVEAAMAWLRAQHGVQERRVHIIGRSRGAELALLAGATLGGVGSVVAYVPSGVTWWGWTQRGWSPSPAWTYRGRRLPCPGRSPGPGFDGTTGPAFFRELLRQRPAESSAAAIPVETIDGDVLLISGGDDQIWPSTDFAALVQERRRAARRSCRHLDYPSAGHMIGYPFVPTPTLVVHEATGRTIPLGGTVHANAAASADSWPHVLRVLESGPG